MTSRPVRLLVFNLATDADDPILGFASRWVAALAERVDAVDVLTMKAGRIDLPANVRVFSVGKEQGYGEPRRAVRFYRLLGRLLATESYGACFAHMMPLFAAMGAPLLRARRVPTTLWFAHKSRARMVRLAEKLVDVVVTSSPEGFRVPSRKVMVVGQGIDTELFSPGSPRSPTSSFTVLCAGRLSRVKRLEVAVQATALLAGDEDFGAVQLRLVGPTFDAAYERELRRQVDDLALGDMVTFVGPRQPQELAAEYRSADVLVSASETGSLDKVNLEAMACGLPVVTSHEAYEPILSPIWPRFVVPRDDPSAVADSCRWLQEMDATQRLELGHALRRVVVEEHSLDRLADHLVDNVLFRSAERPS